jgi:hypothetical protein
MINLEGIARDGGGMANNGEIVSKDTVRSNFISTPLFIGKYDVDKKTGKAIINWKLPDNIGKFEIRAYAISQKGIDS